ncbi:hypothetical protein HNO52_01525 [Billgrantia diversa]|uniref:hypothetical protein n=1 Tax=Halomonas sp. MCCC 1A13316 TaxID=2733487 RepID=UPI0018A3517D|nr:hypothetical protein [Halomonas sp. MCCC 1A13316]QOR37335.1 hypothetical protein HNO52_01525 [Halomonas sp. MCCC 1A13316]
MNDEREAPPDLLMDPHAMGEPVGDRGPQEVTANLESVDFHAVTGPGGGSAVTQAAPLALPPRVALARDGDEHPLCAPHERIA